MQRSAKLDFAITTAMQAAALTLRYFRSQTFRVETKSDGSPVTTADKEAEELVRGEIARRYPDDGVLGEEQGDQPGKGGTCEYRWIVDPIDGTASFVHGVPLFGTMLACEQNGRPILGVIVVPGLNEAVYAEEGGGCWFTRGEGPPVRTRVSAVARLKDALVCSTSLEYFVRSGREALYSRMHHAAKTTRGWSDCYAFVLLATGRIEAVVEPLVKAWDVAAAVPILHEAGGRVTDFAGRGRIDSGDCVASNGAVHDELIGVLR